MNTELIVTRLVIFSIALVLVGITNICVWAKAENLMRLAKQSPKVVMKCGKICKVCSTISSVLMTVFKIEGCCILVISCTAVFAWLIGVI